MRAKHSFKKLIVGVVVLVLIVGALVYVLNNTVLSPASKFQMVLSKGLIEPARDLSTVVTSATDGNLVFSTDMMLRVDLPDWMPEAEFFEDSLLGIKLDSNADGMMAELNLVLMGNEFLSGFINYERDGMVGVYLPELDSRYFVFNPMKLAAGVMGTDLVLDEFDSKMDSSSMQALVDSILKRYPKIVLDSINNDNVSSRSGETVTLKALGATVNGCTVITFTPTMEDLELMRLALVEEIRADQDLAEVLPELADMLEAVEFVEADFQALGFQWEVVLKGLNLVQTRVMYADNVIALELLGSEAKGRDIALTIMEGDSDFLELMRLSYMGARDLVEGSIYFNDSYGHQDLELVFDVNLGKKSALGIPHGNYALRLAALEDEVPLIVEQEGSGSRHTLKLGANYGYDDVDYVFVLDTTDQKSSVRVPEVAATDITDYSSYMIEEIVYQLLVGIESMI